MRILTLFILTLTLLTEIIGQEVTISYFRQVYSVEDNNEFFEDTFIYPKISGLNNKTQQDSLNDSFCREFDSYRKGLKKVSELYKIKIDSSSSYDFSSISSDLYTKENWMATKQKTTVNIIQKKYLNIQSESQMVGNMAAHGNFSFKSWVIDIDKNNQITVNDIIQPEQLEYFKAIANKRLTFGDSTLNCNGSLVLDDWVKSINLKTPINYYSNEYLKLITDTRQLGCPEVERGVMEITIELKEIK
jgi:hypothetical protein